MFNGFNKMNTVKSLIFTGFIIVAYGYEENLNQYSDLATSDVNVIIDPMKIINKHLNVTKEESPQCQLTLHRTLCSNPPIKPHETIEWHTRICFNWKCFNTTEFVMRVEDCWTGSMHSPIYLIDEKGCSREQTMIRSPRYNSNLTQAYSIGRLSVRLLNSKYIRLSCSIRLCDICDADCPSITPPNNCLDDIKAPKIENLWNDTQQLSTHCYHASKEKQINKAAATSFSYTDIFYFICISIITSFLLYQ